MYLVRDAKGTVLYEGDDFDAAERTQGIQARRPEPVAASGHRYTTQIRRATEPEQREISGAALAHVQRVLNSVRPSHNDNEEE